MKYALPIIAIAILLNGCGYNDFDPVPPTRSETVVPNLSLKELTGLFERGETDLPDGLIAGGVITSSDSTGNFYKVLTIQQEETGIAILTGLYDTYVSYKPGDRITILLDGLRLGVNANDGILSVGAPQNEPETGIEHLASEAVVRRIMQPAESGSIDDIRIPTVRISDITQEMTGQLIRVTGGAFTQGGERNWSGEKTYSERRGVSITVYTSPYATFADDILPAGAVDLTGIVTEYKGKLQLKVRSTEDVFSSANGN